MLTNWPRWPFRLSGFILRWPEGWQDQYATVFGGFNFIEFRPDQNLVHPLRIHPDVLIELEESLLLCDTGIQHDSGEIHQDQRQQLERAEIQQRQENVETDLSDAGSPVAWPTS